MCVQRAFLCVFQPVHALGTAVRYDLLDARRARGLVRGSGFAHAVGRLRVAPARTFSAMRRRTFGIHALPILERTARHRLRTPPSRLSATWSMSARAVPKRRLRE